MLVISNFCNIIIDFLYILPIQFVTELLLFDTVACTFLLFLAVVLV